MALDGTYTADITAEGPWEFTYNLLCDDGSGTKIVIDTATESGTGVIPPMDTLLFIENDEDGTPIPCDGSEFTYTTSDTQTEITSAADRDAYVLANYGAGWVFNAATCMYERPGNGRRDADPCLPAGRNGSHPLGSGQSTAWY